MNLCVLLGLESIKVKFEVKDHGVKVNHKYIELICPNLHSVIKVDEKIKGIFRSNLMLNPIKVKSQKPLFSAYFKWFCNTRMM